MGNAEYRQAVAEAEASGVELPVDPTAPPATPWDPGLATAFGEHHLVVREARLLPGLLTDWAAPPDG